MASLAVAQTPARATDPVFVRAQGLVSDGNGAAGRALIDSVIKATSPTARLYPEALFWRASLASNAADAESDYKHIVVDYPLAPQAEDALLRLAQLELARGDREGALIHLQRIPRDYPRSKSLARASYWTARVLFEKNDIPNACAANANALAQAGEAEIELRNQIQYQGQRCSSIAAAVVPPTNSPATAPSTAAPAESQAATAKATVADTISATVPPPSPPPTKATTQDQRPKPPVQANDTKPSIVDPAKSPANPVAKPTVKVPAGASRPAGYSVQVAAYKTRAEADKLTASLTKRGYPARVDADAAYFRVRIGRYSTSKDAEDALKRIKAKQMDGFVVRAPER
ncbi:MAG TPA: SPOR domain-containing protein [Gemmatimonadaceae bacterium]|nr:SPOR domain-containing protein [Gemmatimonadaceae bacterium]